MQSPYAIAEDLCHSKSVSLALLVHYGKQMSHFRETIYDNENSVESCRPKQPGDEVQGNVLSAPLRNRQRPKQSLFDLP
jgi:hypothetical protein